VLCINGGDDRLLARSVGGRLARFYGADHMVFASRGHSLVAESLLATGPLFDPTFWISGVLPTDPGTTSAIS
jgi:hypothetical protein